jgi:DNA-directed RNA polymerase specialized sigma24 family protein
MEMPYLKKEWVLTSDAFGKLLAELDPNPDIAGEKYEVLRRTLVKFFDWRGAPFPEEHADETLNRVTRKLDEGLDIKDLSSYCYGVARLLYLETSKSPDTRRSPISEFDAVAAPQPDLPSDDQRLRCFEQCLETLPVDNRALITEYYQYERRAKIDGRKALAARLGIPLNALRSRATRIREKLEDCVNGCLERGND